MSERSITPLTQKAIAYAMNAHEGQYRKGSGLPYVTHPIAAYSLVQQFKESHNLDIICAAALLHDTIEDCDVTYTNISEEFGYQVAELVQEVTNDSHLIKVYGKEEYMNHKLKGMSSYALVIKIADMIANVSDQPGKPQINRIRNHYHYIRENVSITATHLKMLNTLNKILEEL